MSKRYEIRKAVNDEFYWIFIAANGEEIAKSSETYTSKQNTYKSIDLIKENNEVEIIDTTKED